MYISRPPRVVPILTLTILLCAPHLVLAISPRGTSAISVHGKRAVGSDTATGRGTLTTKGGTLRVTVRRKADTTSGCVFVFTFTATPMR
jgi:hypothetical protein